jgi:SAM-dependent methyltransferase
MEYRRAGYEMLHRHAKARDVLGALETPRTVEELAGDLGIRPERRALLGLFLRALARYGTLTQDGDRFVAADHEETKPFDAELIRQATGADALDSLLHGDSYAGIVDVLYSETNAVGAAFVSANQALWDEFLQTPFYSYFRARAVDAIAHPGATVLDLAAGPGFGLRELAEHVGGDGRVTGVEISSDFVTEAVERLKDLGTVSVVQGNLDHDLPSLDSDSFDGAMLIGAYHFLEQRETFLDSVARVLRPGGTVVLGYVYIDRGSYDQELMDLRLSLREPLAHSTGEQELVDLCAARGLVLADSFAVGCFGWYRLVKDADHRSAG